MHIYSRIYGKIRATLLTHPAIVWTGFQSVLSPSFDSKSKQTNSKPKSCNQLMKLASDDKSHMTRILKGL